MWDDDTGFGGNGTEPDGCVTTGPFANRTEHIGPLEETTDYCFKRIWDNDYGVATELSTVIDDCYSYNDYAGFWYCVSGTLHLGGHAGVGGLVSLRTFSFSVPYVLT